MKKVNPCLSAWYKKDYLSNIVIKKSIISIIKTRILIIKIIRISVNTSKHVYLAIQDSVRGGGGEEIKKKLDHFMNRITHDEPKSLPIHQSEV